jgi:muramidase (phage lysozyme)
MNWNKPFGRSWTFWLGTWDWASRAANVVDFSPEGQHLVAAYLVQHRGAMDAVKAGQFDIALRKCAPEWASLPRAGYDQHENDLAALRSYYMAAGGTLA